MEVRPRDILFLEAGGFTEWIDALENDDPAAYQQVIRRLDRVEDGNFGDCEPCGEGVSELRFVSIGPGYRIYFGEHDDLVIILGAGIKKTQVADIGRAQRLWKEYKNG